MWDCLFLPAFIHIFSTSTRLAGYFLTFREDQTEMDYCPFKCFSAMWNTILIWTICIYLYFPTTCIGAHKIYMCTRMRRTHMKMRRGNIEYIEQFFSLPFKAIIIFSVFVTIYTVTVLSQSNCNVRRLKARSCKIIYISYRSRQR